YFDAGHLGPRARLVAQILLEHYRIQEMGAIDHGSRTTNELHLSSERARLALETVAARPPARMRITAGAESARTVTQQADAAFTHEIYSLNALKPKSGQAPPPIPDAVYREVLAQARAWEALTRPLGDAGYYEVYQGVEAVLEDRAVTQIRDATRVPIAHPTQVVVTRDPDGAIAALGISSLDGGDIAHDYFVTDGRLRLATPPAGEYWVGAGRENILASLRLLNAHYPGMGTDVVTVNPRSLGAELNLYFSDEDSPSLGVPRDGAAFEGVARGLIQRKIALVTQALAELEALNPTGPGASARTARIRARLTPLGDQLAAADSLAGLHGLETQISEIRLELGATSQALRMENPA
ncbi:MAG: hypothetical protein MI749_19090, partial [Desulfovibrionales bacterium]|nr:hypothetical protein [Desulfovibrionales bacterium]